MDNQTPQQLNTALQKDGSAPSKKKGKTTVNVLAERQKHVATDHVGEGSVSKVHVTAESVVVYEMTPPHLPRTQTPMYVKSHKYLVETQDKPCVVCGVRNSTLSDAAQNKFGASTLETHHYPVERSLLEACDPNKVHLAFPEVIDQETLEAFVDSPRNLIVLCDVHHRSVQQGIHHLLVQDYAILPFLYDNYQIVASANTKAQTQENDDEVERSNGEENSPNN